MTIETLGWILLGILLLAVYIFVGFMLVAWTEEKFKWTDPEAKDTWKTWKTTQAMRKATNPENRNYPELRRRERWAAIEFMKEFVLFISVVFWPVALAAMLLYGIFRLIKVILSFFGHVPALYGSIKGE